MKTYEVEIVLCSNDEIVAGDEYGHCGKDYSDEASRLFSAVSSIVGDYESSAHFSDWNGGKYYRGECLDLPIPNRVTFYSVEVDGEDSVERKEVGRGEISEEFENEISKMEKAASANYAEEKAEIDAEWLSADMEFLADLVKNADASDEDSVKEIKGAIEDICFQHVLEANDARFKDANKIVEEHKKLVDME